jgi:SanA protein
VIGLLLGMILGCYGWISLFARRHLYTRSQSIPPQEAVLVLGTAQYTPHGGINQYFRYRMEAAAWLAGHVKAGAFIVSGCDPRHPGITEAAAMKSVLVSRGLPPGDILPDGEAYRTWDSLWRCREVFRCAAPLVVSQRFHVERAIFIGRMQGMSVQGYCARRVGGWVAVRMFVRECLARVKCVWDCFVLRPIPASLRHGSSPGS